MKRISITQWQNSFSEVQSEIITSALQFSHHEKLTDKDAIAREDISRVLNHINVDYQVISAAILLVGLTYKSFNFDNLIEKFEPDIIRLTRESQALIDEEAVWLEKLQDDFSESDVSSHHMMLLGIMKDARTVFILLAMQLVRLHGLSDKSASDRIRTAKETRYIFSPLANRLGIGQLKWELEDLAFRYLQPDDYKTIATALEERRIDREKYMVAVVAQLQSILVDANIDAEVFGRPKHIFSIWKKMQNKKLQFDDLYDVRAMRVMVSDLAACYSVLSVVHELWDFIPQEYDDYIAAPKNNNYQSLHTAVIGPSDKVIEIQIRTEEMHELAEMGVAAHWRYKEGGQYNENLEQHIESLRNALNDNSIENAVINKQSCIYVLSPKGNVVELPVGGTPLDFAYYIHTEVGNRCRGAKINGKMVPLTTQLQSGQTVEILTAKNATPSRDWLISHFGYLKSPRSRSKVKQWFKREFRDEHIASGKLMMSKQVSILPTSSALQVLASTFNMTQVDDLYAAIGRGDLGLQQVLNTLKIPEDEVTPLPLSASSINQKTNILNSIIIEGIDDLLSSLARCCKPMAGDEVVGFVTKGRGVTIHRSNCKNILEMESRFPDRFLPVTWSNTKKQNYQVDIEVHAMDRSGLLRDVTSLLAGENVNVCSANTYTDRKLQQAKMRMTIELSSVDELPDVLAKLQKLRGVFESVRVK